MTLSRELLETLACPRCQGALTLERAGGQDASEALECASCQLVYPLRDGVPELLVSEARPLSSSGR